MSKIKFVLAICSILLLFTPGLKSQTEDKPGINFRPMNLDQALVAAKAENKPVFIHCYADWCPYCKYMRDSVFTNKEVGDFYNAQFICIQLEMEKEGAELNKTLNITTFPSQVFYDTSGQIMHRSVGRRMRQPFIALGKEALDPRRQMRTYQNKFEGDSATPSEIYYYFKTWEYASSHQQQTINDYLMKQKDENFTSPFNWRIIYEFMRDPSLPMMQRVVQNKKELEKKYTTDSVNNKIIAVDVEYLWQYVRRLDSAGFAVEKEKIRKTKGLDIADRVVSLADLFVFMKKSQWDKYKIQAKDIMKKYPLNDPKQVTEMAEVFVEHPGDDHDLKLVHSWLEKSAETNDDYKTNLLMAKASFKRNDKQAAKKEVNKALEIAKRDKVNYYAATELKEQIEALP